MPKIYSTHHDKWVRDYLEKGSRSSKSYERVIYPLHSSGYIVPCTSILRVLPDVSEGIQLVLFLQKVKKKDELASKNLYSSELFSNSNMSNNGISNSIIPTHHQKSFNKGPLPAIVLIDDGGRLLGISYQARTLLSLTVSSKCIAYF